MAGKNGLQKQLTAAVLTIVFYLLVFLPQTLLCDQVSDPGITIAQKGQAAVDIVVSTEPTPAEKTACRELVEYLKKVTGADYTVVAEPERKTGRPAIYLGKTSFAQKNGVDFSKLGNEEWVIRSKSADLILTGGRPAGTLYAVYEFLEKQVGCHWLDEFTEVVPSKPDLKLNNLDIQNHPAFWGRDLSTGPWLNFDSYAWILFNARNKDTLVSDEFGLVRLYGSPGNSHTFYAYSKDWPADHPEYLAMNTGGERVRSTSGAGPGQICLTNPEVRKLMLEQLRQFIKKDRENAVKIGVSPPRIYCIEQNDIPWTCQCPKCKAFIEREEAESGPLIDLVNSLADGIRDEYPDVLIDVFAYAASLKPPKNIRPRDNVIVRLAQLNAEYASLGQEYRLPDAYPDMFRPMTHEVNREALQLLKDWSQIAKHLSYWDYWRIYSLDAFPTPYANLSCIRSDLELFLDNKVEVMMVEMELTMGSWYNHISFCALKHWLGLKLLQNPRQDMEPLLQTFISGYYGPAAGKMREYLDYLERRVASVAVPPKISALKPEERPYLDFEFFVTSQQLLDEAETLCGADNPARLHVRAERIPVDASLYCLWDKLQAGLRAGKTLPFDQQTILRRYESTCLEQMNAFYGKTQLETGKKDLENKIKRLKEIAMLNRLGMLSK